MKRELCFEREKKKSASIDFNPLLEIKAMNSLGGRAVSEEVARFCAKQSGLATPSEMT